jgi:hypothetical protein
VDHSRLKFALIVSSRAGRILVLYAILSIVDLADGGPPFVTDDPEPPPPGGWEINLPFIIERTPGETEMEAPLFDFNYGLPNIQLKLEIPVEVSQEHARGTEVGAGDMLLGVKWRFLKNESSQFQLGTYPQLLVPTGDRARGLGEGGAGFLLPIVAQKNWDKWTVYGNVGFWWQTASESRNYFYAGVVLRREISDRLSLGAELFGNSPMERVSRADVTFNLGGTWKLNDHFNLLFSGGRDISGDVTAMGYIGLQILTK